MKNIHLSLVVPVYNEEAIIEESLNKILKYLKKQKYTWEVVVVDDGSRDRTAQIVRKQEGRGVRLVSLTQNQGKGAALRCGVEHARGDYIVFTDADLSVSIEYLADVLRSLGKHDIAIASRRVKGAKIVRHQPFIRETMGRVFTKLTQLILNSSIADFTCGFKGFRAEPGKTVFGKSLLNRWAYDAEIIFLAHKYNYTIAQVPIIWENRVETRVRIGNAVPQSLGDLVRIRLADLLGKYNV